MQAERLLCKDKDDFIAFCLKHRQKVDESFLQNEDLENFVLSEENPTVIIKRDGNILAAASLIVDEYNRKGRRGRFRIFYSEEDNPRVYSILLSEILRHIHGIDKVHLFVPFSNNRLSEIMKSLPFEIDRYVYILVKETSERQAVNLPQGYSIREFQLNRDEADWCHIRNTAFSHVKGNTTPITPEIVHKQVFSSEYIEGGMLLLLFDTLPVGIIRGVKDEYEGEPVMNIGPLAILPAYQRKGLGRQLLRAAIDFAQKKKYNKVILCVNADNENAKELYLREGFVHTEGVISYELYIS